MTFASASRAPRSSCSVRRRSASASQACTSLGFFFTRVSTSASEGAGAGGLGRAAEVRVSVAVAAATRAPALNWLTVAPTAGFAMCERARAASSGRPRNSYALARRFQSSLVPPSRASRASSAAISVSIDLPGPADFMEASTADPPAAVPIDAMGGCAVSEWREPTAK